MNEPSSLTAWYYQGWKGTGISDKCYILVVSLLLVRLSQSILDILSMEKNGRFWWKIVHLVRRKLFYKKYDDKEK